MSLSYAELVGRWLATLRHDPLLAIPHQVRRNLSITLFIGLILEEKQEIKPSEQHGRDIKPRSASVSFGVEGVARLGELLRFVGVSEESLAEFTRDFVSESETHVRVTSPIDVFGVTRRCAVDTPHINRHFVRRRFIGECAKRPDCCEAAILATLITMCSSVNSKVGGKRLMVLERRPAVDVG